MVIVVGLAAVLAGMLFAGRRKVVTAQEPRAADHKQSMSASSLPAVYAALSLAAGPPPAASPPDTSRYTAGLLRDPLKSMLPKLPSPPSARSQSGTATTDRHTVPAKPVRSSLPSSLTIQGLVWGGPRPQAIINGRVYSVGDTVSGGKIISINRDGVRLDYDGVPAFFPLIPTPKGQRGGQG